MTHTDMPSLSIAPFTARVPIIQGGMGVGVSLSGLASAVASEGGIGVISSVGIGELEPDVHTNYGEAHKRALRRDIRRAREKTNGIIGVNIMVALTDFDDHVTGAIEEEVDIVFMGAGLPLRLPAVVTPETIHTMHTRLVPIVSSGKAATVILKQWKKRYQYVPPAVVVEGPLAGGHLGFSIEQIDDPAYALEKLIPQVIAAVAPSEDSSGSRIAVIAGGGIYTGEDILKFLDMGAAGVQMATRFVTTRECDANIKFKEAYIQAEKEDIIIIKSPVGLPGRAIRNSFLEKASQGKLTPQKCPWKCLHTCDVVSSPYCIAQALVNAREGRLEQGFAFCGANAYRADRITTVHEVFESLKQEYREAVKRKSSAAPPVSAE